MSEIYKIIIGLFFFLLCLVPFYITKKDKFYNLKNPELFPFLAGIYGIYYASPLVMGSSFEVAGHNVVDLSIFEAAFTALFGWIFLLCGYYFKKSSENYFSYDLVLSDTRCKSLANFFILSGILFSYLSRTTNAVVFDASESTFTQIYLILASFLQIGLGFYLTFALEKKIPVVQRRILYTIILPGYLFSLSFSGSVGGLIAPSVFFIFIFYNVAKKIPWIFLALTFSAFLILRPAMETYRSYIWFGGSYSNAGIFERAKLLGEIVGDIFLSGRNDVKDDVLELTTARTNQLSVLAAVIQQTPESVEFWKGETYLTLLSTPIPRFLWPNKPAKDLGQQFGHRYGFIGDFDITTSFNLPQIAEFYANFGLIGVFFGMYLTGRIYRYLYELFSQKNGITNLVFGAYIFSKCTNIESDFSLVFGGILQSIIVLYIIKYFITKRL